MHGASIHMVLLSGSLAMKIFCDRIFLHLGLGFCISTQVFASGFAPDVSVGVVS